MRKVLLHDVKSYHLSDCPWSLLTDIANLTLIGVCGILGRNTFPLFLYPIKIVDEYFHFPNPVAELQIFQHQYLWINWLRCKFDSVRNLLRLKARFWPKVRGLRYFLRRASIQKLYGNSKPHDHETSHFVVISNGIIWKYFSNSQNVSITLDSIKTKKTCRFTRPWNL